MVSWYKWVSGGMVYKIEQFAVYGRRARGHACWQLLPCLHLPQRMTNTVWYALSPVLSQKPTKSVGKIWPSWDNGVDDFPALTMSNVCTTRRANPQMPQPPRLGR